MHRLPSKLETDTMAAACKVLVKRQSEKTLLEHHHDQELLQKAAQQAEVVKALTKSNHETFECLKVFCEKYRDKRTTRTSRSTKKIYKYIVEQAGVYVTTIDVSLSVAEKGVAISRTATSALEDAGQSPDAMVGMMLEQAKGALKEAKDIADRFRAIRVAIYNEMQRLAPDTQRMGAEGGMNATHHDLNANDLRKMGDNDLLKLTLAVLDQFVSIVGKFVDWWSSLQVDVDRLTFAINFIRKNPAITTQVQTQWQNVEAHYSTYRSEIMTQQDYYNRALKDLMPKSFLHRVAHRLGLE